MSKDTARQEVEKVCFAYEKAGKTGNKKDWGKFYDLEEPLIKKVEVANQPKLSIPKKIAEGLDEENYKDLIDFIKEGFFVSEEVDKWYYGINQDQIDENGKFVVNKIDTNKSILIVAYLLSKTLGVDLVEVAGE